MTGLIFSRVDSVQSCPPRVNLTALYLQRVRAELRGDAQTAEETLRHIDKAARDGSGVWQASEGYAEKHARERLNTGRWKTL